jgi:hypothetical protein
VSGSPAALPTESIGSIEHEPSGRWAWTLPIAVGVLTAALRWWSGRDRRMFTSPFDEGSQLAIARSLAGEQDWHTRGLAYRPGLGTLLAPVHWLTTDPTTTYRAALLANALLGGVSAVLLIALGVRLTSLSLRWCSVLALVVSVAPGTLFMTNWVRPETLVTTLFLATVLALVALVDRPGWPIGALAVTLAALAYTTHGRTGPLVASVCLVIAYLVFRRRLSWTTGVGLVVLAAVLTALSQWYATWTIDTVWVSSRGNDIGGVIDKLLAPSGVFLSLLGMTWYQLVTTVGMVGTGAWVVVATLRHGAAPTGIALRRAHAGVIAVTTLPLVVVPAVFLSRPDLASQMVYGRYWDAVLGPVILLGLAVLVSGNGGAVRRSALAGVGSLVLVGVTLAVLRQADIDAAIERAGGVRPGARILGLLGYIGARPEIPVVAITALALAIHGALVGAALLRLNGRAAAAPAAMTGLLALGLVANVTVWRAVEPNRDRLVPAEAVGEIAGAGLIGPDGEVGFRLGGPRLPFHWWMAYQFYLPQFDIHAIDDEVEGEHDDAPYVFARQGDPTLRRSGAELLWSRPDLPFGLWARGGG